LYQNKSKNILTTLMFGSALSPTNYNCCS